MRRSWTVARVGTIRARGEVVGRHVRSWSPESRDAVLYGGSALFAGLTYALSGFALYQQWALMAVGPYAAGAVASGFLAHHRASAAAAADGHGSGSPGGPGGRDLPAGEPGRNRRPSVQDGSAPHWGTVRIAIFLFVLLGATLVPLALEVAWRTTGPDPAAHVQPEVTDVEHAGSRLAADRDPYQLVDRHDHLLVRVAGQPAWEPYFPYLPAMALLGLPRSTHAPAELTDARILFSVTTFLLVALALAVDRGPNEPRVRSLQVLTLLPCAALPLATGGDDMPVVACLFLAMVLLQRRKPLLGGAAMGIAVSLKFTAWPLAVLALFAAKDASGRRSPVRMAVGMGAVVAPLVLPTALWNPWAFIDNAVQFPLGLAAVASPAASALPGHLFVTAFPSLHRAYAITAGAIGLLLLVRHLHRHPVRDAAGATRLTAWVMAIAIVLAPATRVGYLLYPVDLFVWAWMFRREDEMSDPTAVPLEVRVPASSTA